MENPLNGNAYYSISYLIESREGSYQFKRNTYNEKLLREIIVQDEYDKIVNKASKIMANAILKKKVNDKFEISLLNQFFFVINVILLILFILTFYYSQTRSKYENLFYPSIIFLVLSIAITFLRSFYNFFRKTRDYQTVDEIIQNDLDDYFKNINQFYSNNLRNKTGSIEFRFIPVKKYIECIVEQLKPEDSNLSNYGEEEVEISDIKIEDDNIVSNIINFNK
jgi:hypothetical protein